MMKHVLTIVAVLTFSIAVQAGVTVVATTGTNSAGNDIYTITATSDDALISSLGLNVVGNGNIGQEYTMLNKATHLDDNNDLIVAFGGNPDTDSQGKFNTIADALLIVAGFSDTDSLYDINFTGFVPFASREVMQIVLTQGTAVATIGVVAGGVEYSIIPTAQGPNGTALVPEPASLSLLAIGGLLAIRRR